METTTTFNETLEQFLQSNDFKAGVIASTRASWGGSGYSVELFPDGTRRTLWSNEIGNRYDSPGVILGLPVLDDSGLQEALEAEYPMSEEEYLGLCFANEEAELAESLRQSLKEALYG